MKSDFIFDPSLSREELRGFSRTVAEIQWLLLILVMFYQFVLVPDAVASTALTMAMCFYAAFVLLFRYVNFYRQEKYWKLALETVMMIVFITWVLAYTGRLASPLVNLYLLVVITSSLTLGRTATVLAMIVITGCYVWLGYPARHTVWLYSFGTEIITQLSPMVLVAYVTTMLSADTRRAMAQIKHLSETDELTGVLNRRAFLAIASRIFSQSQRYARTFSIIMIDSDSLKQINDKHGHDMGDELIRLTERCVQGELRKADLAARYGGDEFVVLLPDTPSTSAVQVAERIRLRIAATPFQHKGEQIVLSVSMGVASFPTHGKDFDAVFERADSAMYQSKNAGKNRVSIAAAIA